MQQMSKKFCILVVDDDVRILNFIRSKLEASGYALLVATDGQQALSQVRTGEPDLIILDLMMPGMSGFDVLKEMRDFSMVPIIILSARDSTSDKVKGLSMGADDYLPKPFNPDELLARIEAVRRRLDPAQNRLVPIEPMLIGGISIDFRKHTVNVGGQEKYLTHIEWQLLNELAHHIGCLLTYEDLLTRIWGPEYRDDAQLLRTWISRLRSKIEIDANGALIRTIPKAGYILDQPGEQDSQA